MRQTWIDAASTETWRRARREELRGVAHTCLRVWRERTDGIPARAAKWDNRWRAAQRHGHDIKLARNMCKFTRVPRGMLPLLFAYQRLVAASSHICQPQRRSPLWRESQRARQRSLVGHTWHPRRRLPNAAVASPTTHAQNGSATPPPHTHAARRRHTHTAKYAPKRRHDGQLRLHSNEYVALMDWGTHGDG